MANKKDSTDQTTTEVSPFKDKFYQLKYLLGIIKFYAILSLAGIFVTIAKVLDSSINIHSFSTIPDQIGAIIQNNLFGVLLYEFVIIVSFLINFALIYYVRLTMADNPKLIATKSKYRVVSWFINFLISMPIITLFLSLLVEPRESFTNKTIFSISEIFFFVIINMISLLIIMIVKEPKQCSKECENKE